MANKMHYAKGLYEVEVIGSDFVEPTETKPDGSKKADYIELKFKVMAEVTQLGVVPEAENKERSTKSYMSPAAMDQTMDKFAALGLKSWLQLPELIGRRVRMICKEEVASFGKNAGDTFEKWELPFSGESTASPIAAAKASMLQKKYGGSLLQAFGKSTAKPVTVPNDLGISDDDIPF